MSEKNNRGSKGQRSGKRSSNKKNTRKKSNSQKVQAFNFNNIDKVGKTFMYHNLTKSKCYNPNFSQSNFDFACFRGAHLKSCFFNECSFKGSEFVGSNLKDSKFTGAQFEDVVFESVKMEGADFKDAQFKNTIILSSNLDGVKNLDLNDENIRVFDEMPQVSMSTELQELIEGLMTNAFIKKSRVLDTREGNINLLSVMILLEKFDEETLIKAFKVIEPHIERDFFTLSFIIRLITKLEKDGII